MSLSDIFTSEDKLYLHRNSALEPLDRIRCVETGKFPNHPIDPLPNPFHPFFLNLLPSPFYPFLFFLSSGGCPHAAIREDISANMEILEQLQAKYQCELLFVESGGDNLAAAFSVELADLHVYVIDVAGGDKVPRKGGPGESKAFKPASKILLCFRFLFSKKPTQT